MAKVLGRDYSTGTLGDNAAWSNGVGRTTDGTLKDWEGRIVTAMEGEARFEGLRRVENKFPYSEDFTNALWSLAGTTASKVGETTIDGVPCMEMSCNGNADGMQQSIPIYLGQQLRVTAMVRAKLPTGQIRIKAQDQYTGVISIQDSWMVITSDIWTETSASGNRRSGIGFLDVDFYLAWMLCEDVTGQPNQNPGSYVSTNAESSPFHGALVDGVQYFDYQNPNTVTSNVVDPNGAPATPITGGYLLLEPSSNTIVKYSRDLTNAVWVKQQSGATLTATHDQIGIDGTQSASLVEVTNASGGWAYFENTVTLSAPGHSIWARAYYKKDAGSGQVARLGIWVNGETSKRYQINITISDGSVAESDADPTQHEYDLEEVNILGEVWYKATIWIVNEWANSTYNVVVGADANINGQFVVDSVMSKSQLDMSISDGIRDSNIYSEGSVPVTRTTDLAVVYPLTTPQAEGSVEVGLVDYDTTSAPTAAHAVAAFAQSTGNGPILRLAGTTALASDGTNTSSVDLAPLEAMSSHWQAGSLQVGYRTAPDTRTFGTDVSYEGGFASDGNVYLLYQPQEVTRITSLDAYNDADFGGGAAGPVYDETGYVAVRTLITGNEQYTGATYQETAQVLSTMTVDGVETFDQGSINETALISSAVTITAVETSSIPIYAETAAVGYTLTVNGTDVYSDPIYQQIGRVNIKTSIIGHDVFTGPLPEYNETAVLNSRTRITATPIYTGPSFAEQAQVGYLQTIVTDDSYLGPGNNESTIITTHINLTAFGTWTPPVYNNQTQVSISTRINADDTFTTPSMLPEGIQQLTAQSLGGFTARII